MQGSIVSQQTEGAVHDAKRLYYIDWLRIVSAITLTTCPALSGNAMQSPPSLSQ